MRADRLLSILMMLQLRTRTTAGYLAEQLKVSERTIYRDIEALERSGVPIFTDRGRSGGAGQASSPRPNGSRAVRRLGLGRDDEL